MRSKRKYFFPYTTSILQTYYKLHDITDKKYFTYKSTKYIHKKNKVI